MDQKRKYFTIGNVFGEGFNLYFKNIIKFCLPSFVCFLPVGFLFYKYFTILEFGINGVVDISYPGLYIILMMIIGIIVLWLILIEFKLASNAYLDKDENLTDILKKTIRRFFPFLGMNIVLIHGIWLGALLLIVPGIILLFGWCLAQVVFILEDEKAMKSLKRSWNLTKGFKGKLFLLYILAIIALYIALVIIFLIIAGSFYVILAGLEGSQISNIIGSPFVYPMVLVFLYTLMVPLYTSFMTIIYYNIKKEKEGFETEHLAGSFLNGRDSPPEAEFRQAGED